MSALTERIAAKHQRVFNNPKGVGTSCTCGWYDTQYDGSQKHNLHIAEVTEAAVREQIAAELTALSETTWDAYKNGFGIERAYAYTEGQSDAYDTAATLAKGTP